MHSGDSNYYGLPTKKVAHTSTLIQTKFGTKYRN